MIPRGKIYFSYTDIAAGITYSLKSLLGFKQLISLPANHIICLSVRTGFDLALRALNLPPGSEILVTDINIPDMFHIIALHQFVAVPLAVNKHTLSLSVTQVEQSITSKTKAILITHLFGGIMDTTEIVKIAKANGLIIFEDCAQAYAGNLYIGNEHTDVVMFSFGFIKTDTAINGAVLKIRDAKLLSNITELNSNYPTIRSTRYFKKILKTAFVKLLTNKAIYTLLYKLTGLLRKDFDDVLSGFTKGFPGEDILKQIRYRESEPNRLMLQRKLDNFDLAVIEKRIERAKTVLDNIPDQYKIGMQNLRHTYWVLPIECSKPIAMIDYLRKRSFDPSQKASSLVKLRDLQPDVKDELMLDRLVYLPMSDAMTETRCLQLADLITEFDK